VNSLTNWPLLPNPKVPMLFAHTEGIERREPDSPSWFNEQEIDKVRMFVDKLLPFVSSSSITFFIILFFFSFLKGKILVLSHHTENNVINLKENLEQ
jgi:hypothetical protein